MNDFFCALSVVLAILSLILSTFAVQRAKRVVELPRAKLRSIESRIESCESSDSELLQLVRDLANSQKMTKVRTAARLNSSAPATTSDPDPYTDPDAWRKMMSKRIAMSKLGGSKL